MYTFDHTSFEDFRCYLRYRKNRHDKLLAAKLAALENGDVNVAQNLTPRIEQAFEDFVSVYIPDTGECRYTVEYLEPDINDPLNQSYKQTTHPLDNHIPLLNSHYTSINLDDITIKTPPSFVNQYKASGSFTRISMDAINSQIDFHRVMLTHFVQATIDGHLSDQHFCFSMIDIMATELTFFEELWFLRTGLPDSRIHYGHINQKRIKSRLTKRLNHIQHQLRNSIDLTHQLQTILDDFDPIRKELIIPESNLINREELPPTPESPIDSTGDDHSATQIESNCELDSNCESDSTCEPDSGCETENDNPDSTDHPTKTCKISVKTILGFQPATSLLSKPVRPVSGERYGRDTVRSSFLSSMLSPKSTLLPTTSRPPAEPPPVYPVQCV